MYAISEQGLTILRGQRDILELALGKYAPDQVGYDTIVTNYKHITGILGDCIVDGQGAALFTKVKADPIPEPTPIVKEEEPAPIEEVKLEEIPEPYVEPTPFDVEPAPFDVEPKPIADKTYSKAEVRAALGQARLERNVDINAIIRTLGFSQFGEVPASKYGELMEAIANA